MSTVRIDRISKSYADHQVLREVSLEVAEAEFLAVLGPSGCGKTTLLRCLAGFERIDAGHIAIGERSVADARRHLPAHQRQVVIVPQEGSLFPHLNVAENVAFGLSGRSVADRAQRVAECLALVGLPGSQHRSPHELSGGMRQRVAVARALAPRPPLILLDEPFSALDAGLRAGLRADVRAALAADGATVILVTHDQGEALSMADRVAVLEAGVVRQVDTPQQVYDHPGDEWVARFLGEANILPVGADGRTVVGTPGEPGTTAVVRPESLELTDAPGPKAGVVAAVDYHGHDLLVRVVLDEGPTVTVRMLSRGALPVVGQRVGVRARTDRERGL